MVRKKQVDVCHVEHSLGNDKTKFLNLTTLLLSAHAYETSLPARVHAE